MPGLRFKIGRCQARDLRFLKYRPMYEGHTQIGELFRGSAEEVAECEARAIKAASKRYGDACVNDHIGGGPLGNGDEHSVYIVAFRGKGRG